MSDHLWIAGQTRRLWRHLLPRRKRQLGSLALIMIVAAFAEVMSIGTVLPFLGVLTNPEKIFFHELTQPIVNFLQIKSPQDLLLPFTLAFVSAALLSGIFRIALLWFQTRLSMGISADFSIQVYERTLYQPYICHLSRNSSEILTGIQKTNALVGSLIQPIFFILSSLAILLFVITTMIVIQPVVALTTCFGFGVIYASVVVTTKARIAKNSKVIASRQIQATKAIQEGLGGIRDVIIDATQSVYSKLYKDSFIPMQTALANNRVVSGIPKYVIEALAMALIAGVAYILAQTSGTTGGVTQMIPVLGALVLGAQRVLPLMQQVYTGYITIMGNKNSTVDALDLIDQAISNHVYSEPAVPMPLKAVITLQDVGFRYTPQGPWVLRNVNLEIPKGGRVGFIGVSGAGKSTLLDIIMGLLTPTEGVVKIDNISITPENTRFWQKNISHVPQSIYLSDTSIAENIALGVPLELIDLKRVKQVAEKAEIAQIIEGWENGYRTLVGERGVRLSGGQRQRIGIARALYKQATVIILDEATSALDNETENAVIQAVETVGRDITILVIAHRLTTLKNCDRIVEISNGKVKFVSDYNQMLRAVTA
jgi:ABC-type bacteriocin/lantibiotic exporter with double-glycine peptidase domain